jgi:hypothetical protein
MAPYSDPAHKGNQKYPPQPTPTRQIGVEPNGQPRNYQNPNLARKWVNLFHSFKIEEIYSKQKVGSSFILVMKQ